MPLQRTDVAVFFGGTNKARWVREMHRKVSCCILPILLWALVFRLLPSDIGRKLDRLVSPLVCRRSNFYTPCLQGDEQS